MSKTIRIKAIGENADGSLFYPTESIELFDGSKFGVTDVVLFENLVDADMFLDRLPYFVEEVEGTAMVTITVPPFHPMPGPKAVPELEVFKKKQ